MVRPLRECSGAAEIAVVGKGSIGHKPLFVLLEELLEGLALHHLAAFLSIEFAQILHLGIVHPLVVNLRQGVQFFLQSVVVGLACLVLEGRQLAQVGILRMQGIDADGVVRIGILPGMSDVRIVDGEYLQHALLRLGAPVDHQLQVAEVAHAEATLAAEREDGNHRAGTLPRIDGEIGLRQFIDHHLAEFNLGQCDGAVGTVFP